MSEFIPLYQPSIGERERACVNECLDSTWISSKGRFIEQFEAGFAGFTGLQHGISVCNGTVALHVALLALGIGPGDEVIVPTLTYIASVNAISYTGARPVFVDSDPRTWQMSAADVERKITSNTRALLVVHLYGHPCDMNPLMQIARRHGLRVVEDCAEAIGTRYAGTHVGRFGDLATFSFFGNKTISTGEGGMILTDDPELAYSCRHLKGQGLVDGREYWHDVIGFNYRMTNICAALGVAQLERVDEFLARKRELAARYRRGLRDTPLALHEEAQGSWHSYWMVSVLVPHAALREPLRQQLRQAGIETRPLFYPVHTMPMYSAAGEQHPVATDLGARGINLPSWPELGNARVDRICAVIAEFFAQP